MLYIKQFLRNKWTPWIVDWVLTEIKGDNIPQKLLLSKGVFKKCTYGFSQYLFMYRLIYLKTIEILDCILLKNQEPFVEPHKHIHVYYPFLVFMYTDIGVFRKKFFWERAVNIVDFEEIESLAGDPTTMVKTWKRVRSDYLNYKGEIENRFACNGFKEYPVPPRIKLIFKQIDELLDDQKSRYSPTKTTSIKFSKGLLQYQNKKIHFKVSSVRQKLLSVLINNPPGIKSKEIKTKLELSTELFKTNIRQINKRLVKVSLAIRYDSNKKVYLLSE